MQESDKAAFAEAMTIAGAALNRPITKEMLQAFWAVLNGHSIEDVQSALNETMRSSRFFPTPADLIERIEGNPAVKAAEAWRMLVDGISKVGPHQTVVFPDRNIHYAVEQMGGWQEICQWKDSDLPFRQKDFEKLYASAATRSVAYPAKLVGAAESHNMMRGLPAPDPVMIGSPQACTAVLEGGSTGPRTQITRASQIINQLENPNGSNASEGGQRLLRRD